MAIARAQLVDVSLTRWYPRAYLTKTRGNSTVTGSVGTPERVNPFRLGRQTQPTSCHRGQRLDAVPSARPVHRSHGTRHRRRDGNPGVGVLGSSGQRRVISFSRIRWSESVVAARRELICGRIYYRLCGFFCRHAITYYWPMNYVENPTFDALCGMFSLHAVNCWRQTSCSENPTHDALCGLFSRTFVTCVQIKS